MSRIKVSELFAGVGGFRVGLERASNEFEFVFANQWEPSTKTQHAANIYKARFGDVNNKNVCEIECLPECDMVVGGFPCQDYSVATSSDKSKGIEGKKGVLWWQRTRLRNP